MHQPFIFFGVASALTLTFNAHAQVGKCTPTTPQPKQARSLVKHRPLPRAQAKAKSVKVTEVLAWDPPAGVATNKKLRSSSTTIDPKEKQIYIIEADVQLARIEGNDCDVHLEISERGAGKNGDRMIVEIPADVSPAARKTLLDAVHVDLTEVPKYEPDPPLKITVTGYGFWDGAHYSPANPKQGHLHGSANVKNLWELHPVSKLVVTP